MGFHLNKIKKVELQRLVSQVSPNTKTSDPFDKKKNESCEVSFDSGGFGCHHMINYSFFDFIVNNYYKTNSNFT